jgi:WXG100 family type VII secretion target
MSLIQVTPEMLRSRASDARRLKGEHEQVIQRLDQLVLGLNDIWKGRAQDAFVAQYQGMKSTFQNFAEMLENHALLMDKSANELETTDTTLANVMK